MTSVANLITAIAAAGATGQRTFIAQRDRTAWLPSQFPYADDPQLVVWGPDVIAICDYCEGMRAMRERAGTLNHIECMIRLPRDLSDHVSRQEQSADDYIATLIRQDAAPKIV